MALLTQNFCPSLTYLFILAGARTCRHIFSESTAKEWLASTIVFYWKYRKLKGKLASSLTNINSDPHQICRESGGLCKVGGDDATKKLERWAAVFQCALMRKPVLSKNHNYTVWFASWLTFSREKNIFEMILINRGQTSNLSESEKSELTVLTKAAFSASFFSFSFFFVW